MKTHFDPGRKWLHRKRCAALLFHAAVAAVGACTAHAASFSATWVSAQDGTWSDAPNWSTNPNFPNNDSPNVGDTYDALIGATGASYTVTLNSDITVNSLTLNSASATLNQMGGVFSAINGINIQSGTYAFNGGEIDGGTIATSGGGTLLMSNAEGRLDGVTLDTDVTLTDYGLQILDGLTLAGHTLTLNSVNTTSQILTDNTLTLGGNGTIVFSGSGNGSVSGGGGSITVGSSFTVRTGTAGGIIDLGQSGINLGTISAQTTGQTLAVSGNNWSNGGTLQAINGSTLSLAGTVAANGLGNMVVNGGTIELTGGLSNSSNTLVLSTPLYLNGGSITGGTIATSGNGALLMSNSTGLLDGVTLDTDVNVTDYDLMILDGLTLAGHTLTLNNVNASSEIVADNAITLGGNGTIVFGGSGDNRVVSSGGSITVGSSFTVRTGAAGGFIDLGPSGTNLGTISAQTTGQTLTVSGINWSNGGTLQAINGSTLSLGGTVAANGLGNMVVNGGTIELIGGLINSSNTLVLSTPLYLNGGSITGGTIATSGNGALLLMNNSNGLLDGVTLNTDVTLNVYGLEILDGLTLAGHTLTLNSVNATSQIVADNALALGGNGTIVFSGSGDNDILGGSTTIGSNITIRTGTAGGSIGADDVLVNDGTIIAGTAGTTIQIGGLNSFTNNGTLIANNGSTISLGGYIPVGGLGTYLVNGGTVVMGGTLDNCNHSLTLPQNLVVDGTIIGGTISTSNGAQLVSGNGGGDLSGVTLNTDLTVNSFFSIENGLTLTNHTITLNASDSVILSSMSETIGGTGTILFADPDDNPILEVDSGALSIGPGITIRTTTGGGKLFLGDGALFQGTILSQIAGHGVAINTNGDSWTNTGTLSASNGGTIDVSDHTVVNNPTDSLTNYSAGVLTGGHYYVFAGTTINFGTSTITTNAADIRLDGANSVFGAINSLLTNNGTFTVANGRSFTFAGNITNNLGGDIIAAAGGTITIPGGSSEGTIESQTGGTIIFNGSFNHGTTSFLEGDGSLIFSGGTQIFNGTINGNFDLTLNGAAQFGAQSVTNTTGALTIRSGGGSITNGAQIGIGALNFITGAASPAVALIAGATPAKLTLNGTLTVNSGISGTSSILNVGTAGIDSILDLGGGNRTFLVNNNGGTPDLLITPLVQNGGITTSGGGVIELTHSNTYAGGTTLSGNGTFEVANPHALGSGSVTFADGGQGGLNLLSDQTLTTYSNPLFAAPANSMLLHVNRITSGTAGTFITGPATLGSSLSVDGAGTLQIPAATLNGNITVQGATNLEFAGAIAGTGSLTSNGSVIFSGITSNSYSGTTVVNGGVLQLNKTSGMNAIPHDLLMLGGTVQLLQSNQIADNAMLSFGNAAAGSGVVNLGSSSETIGGLSNGTVSGGGGTVAIPAGSVLRIDGTYLNNGTIALSGSMISDYSGASPLAAIAAQAASGFAHGAWTGRGINSVAAATDPTHRIAVGYAEASALNLSTFAGQPVDSTAVVVGDTYAGDADLSGTVDVTDFNRLAAHFNSRNAVWSDGDFNYDGVVNAEDFDLLARNYGQTLSQSAPPPALSLGTLVPEPAAVAVLSAMILVMRRRLRTKG